MTRLLPLAPLALLALICASPDLAAEPKSPTGGTPLCKDLCVKDCMGNDTPTERANCLARENCDARPACSDTKPKLNLQHGLQGPKTGLPKLKAE